MKRLISALLLLALLAGSAAALTDKEYLRLKKEDGSFSQADDRLNELWKELKSMMSTEDFKALQKENSTWLKTGRDEAAKSFINDGLDKDTAYAEATWQRVTYLAEIKAKQVYGAGALTQNQAQEILMNYLQKNHKFEKNNVLMPANLEPEKEDGEEFWFFRHAVDLKDRTSTIRFYYVRIKDGAIYATDPEAEDDKLVPVE